MEGRVASEFLLFDMSAPAKLARKAGGIWAGGRLWLVGAERGGILWMARHLASPRAPLTGELLLVDAEVAQPHRVKQKGWRHLWVAGVQQLFLFAPKGLWMGKSNKAPLALSSSIGLASFFFCQCAAHSSASSTYVDGNQPI